jgi:predicted polyphosphate/ATP-dependent NAD kinase
MSAVGIIANPASGKDIRRLVAQASVFDNNEKVNIIRRILRALDALGIRQVFIMPDTSGLGLQALDGLRLGLEVRFIEMPVYGDARDSATAARILAERGVACIITLGGCTPHPHLHRYQQRLSSHGRGDSGRPGRGDYRRRTGFG